MTDIEEERQNILINDISKTINNNNNKTNIIYDKSYNNDKIKKRKPIPFIDKVFMKIIAILFYIETKIFALISVGLAGFLTYYSNFFKVLHEHSHIDSFYFYLAVLLYLISISIILYLSFYLPNYKNINEDQWEEYCPNMIPIATITGLAGMITLIICIWDVWGWLSIPLIGFIKWGFIMTVHFAPGGTIGNLVFVICLIGLLVSRFFIEHEGYLHKNDK